jgi:hypothetical protein
MCEKESSNWKLSDDLHDKTTLEAASKIYGFGP